MGVYLEGIRTLKRIFRPVKFHTCRDDSQVDFNILSHNKNIAATFYICYYEPACLYFIIFTDPTALESLGYTSSSRHIQLLNPNFVYC